MLVNYLFSESAQMLHTLVHSKVFCCVCCLHLHFCKNSPTIQSTSKPLEVNDVIWPELCQKKYSGLQKLPSY